MKRYIRYFLGILIFCLGSFAQSELPPEYTEIAPAREQMKPYSAKYVLPFVGLDIGGGFTQEPRGTFNFGVHGGITFLYRDMQSTLMDSVLALFLNTSLYAGVDFNLSVGRFTWAPKLGVAQLLGPIMLGVEASVSTPSAFQSFDVRIQPYFGLSLLNIFTFTVGPNFHVGGTNLSQIPRWRAYFTIRLPIELISYFSNL
jgi:hypothetical protein